MPFPLWLFLSLARRILLRMTGAHAGLISPYATCLSSRYFPVLSIQSPSLPFRETSFSTLNIPLKVTSHTPRITIPSHVLSIIRSLGATRLFANMEYELDELRRDTSLCRLAQESGVKVELFHDRCVVEPGVVVREVSVMGPSG